MTDKENKDEQYEKLKALYESENPKPRNRAERRLQFKNRHRKKVGEWNGENRNSRRFKKKTRRNGKRNEYDNKSI